jgi:hypothetical protein
MSINAVLQFTPPAAASNPAPFIHGYHAQTNRVFVRCTVNPELRPYRWYPPLLPLSRLHRTTLVDRNLFGLRTGDLPLRVWFGKYPRLHPDHEDFFRARRGETLESLMTGPPFEEEGTWEAVAHLYKSVNIFEDAEIRFIRVKKIARDYLEPRLLPPTSFRYARAMRRRKSRARVRPVMLEGVSVEQIVAAIASHRWDDATNAAIYDWLVLNGTRPHPLSMAVIAEQHHVPIRLRTLKRNAVAVREEALKCAMFAPETKELAA